MIPAALGLSILFQPAPNPSLQDFDEELRSLVTGVVERGLEQDRAPGAAVVVVRDGEPVLVEGFGTADLATGRKVDPERTIWRIGSVTKAVTAVAALVLADREVLALDDPVEKHAPGLVPAVERYGEPVRIVHLLEHTGGFDQIGSERNFFDPDARPSLRAFLERDLVPIRPPGDARCYDTYGISLAGELVARATKQPYPEAMAALVFAPLGMQRTWVEAPAEERKELATGYGLTGGELVPQDYEYYASLPASSIDATAVDMGRLMVALLGDGSNETGRLFSPQAADTLKGDESPESIGRGFPGFAYGFWESLGRSTRVLHHGGTMRGYSCELTLVPKWSLGVFVAVNRDAETGPPVGLLEAVTAAVVDFHSFEESELELAPESGPVLAPEELAGVYTQNLWCHTRPPGRGWPAGEFVPVRAVDEDAIELWGEHWQRCAPNEFQRPGHLGRVGFERSGPGRPLRFVLSWTPGTVYERLDEALIEEVLGPQTDESPPSPLAATVYRANERWQPASAVYAALAATYDEGSAPRALSDFFAGQAFARQGQPVRAEPHLLAAQTGCAALAESGVPGADFYAELSRRSILELVIASAQAGEVDAAFDWLEHAVRELGIPADAVRAQVADNPWLETLRDPARLERLGR